MNFLTIHLTSVIRSVPTLFGRPIYIYIYIWLKGVRSEYGGVFENERFRPMTPTETISPLLYCMFHPLHLLLRPSPKSPPHHTVSFFSFSLSLSFDFCPLFLRALCTCALSPIFTNERGLRPSYFFFSFFFPSFFSFFLFFCLFLFFLFSLPYFSVITASKIEEVDHR